MPRTRPGPDAPYVPDVLAPGSVVEMTAILVAVDAARLRAYRILGERPAGSQNGLDYFGVSIGERARVLGQEGDAVRVEFLGGDWKGRSGWVARASVRVPPTEVESSADVAGGLPLIARRQIYAARNAAGFAATAEAERSHPFDRMPTEAEAIRAYLAGRSEAYEAALDRGRRQVLERYGIDAAQLDRIEAEGDRERWPVWDGLADDQGPIPTFGPARTDEQGRLVMDDEEENAARRDASMRALKAIGRITDETDTDEVWDEVLRSLRGAH